MIISDMIYIGLATRWQGINKALTTDCFSLRVVN